MSTTELSEVTNCEQCNGKKCDVDKGRGRLLSVRKKTSRRQLGRGSTHVAPVEQIQFPQVACLRSFKPFCSRINWGDAEPIEQICFQCTGTNLCFIHVNVCTSVDFKSAGTNLCYIHVFNIRTIVDSKSSEPIYVLSMYSMFIQLLISLWKSIKLLPSAEFGKKTRQKS